MYFPINKVRVPPGNIRRSIAALVFATVAFVTFGFARLFKFSSLEYYALMTTLALLPLSIALAVPYIMLAVVLILSPFGVYFFLDSPSLPVVRQWWFWVFTAAAIAAGIGILAIAEKRYPKREP